MQLQYITIVLTTLVAGISALPTMPLEAEGAALIPRAEQDHQVDQSKQANQQDQSEQWNDPNFEIYRVPRQRQVINIGNVRGPYGANSPYPGIRYGYYNQPRGPLSPLYSRGGVQRLRDRYGNEVVVNGFPQQTPCPNGVGICYVA